MLGTQRDKRSAAPTTNESSWVSAWGKWRRAVYRDIDRAQDLALGDSEAFIEALRPLADCEGFESRVPIAPFRYDRARSESEEVCSVLKTMPALGERLVRGDGRASADFGLANDRVGVLLAETEETLRNSLSFNRSLPRRQGVLAGSRIEPRFGGIASTLAGREVEARCWSQADWHVVVAELGAFYGQPRDRDLSGFAEPAVSQKAKIHLAPYVCVALTHPESYPERDLSFAVNVLAHESEHIVSATSLEAVTECHAVQTIARTAELLGLSAQRGRELANRYWHFWYLRNPVRYRTVRCSQGGPLDETPGDGVWP